MHMSYCQFCTTRLDLRWRIRHMVVDILSNAMLDETSNSSFILSDLTMSIAGFRPWLWPQPCPELLYIPKTIGCESKVPNQTLMSAFWVTFLPAKKPARGCVFQISSFYPSLDLNPGPSCLKHSTLTTRLRQILNRQESWPKGSRHGFSN